MDIFVYFSHHRVTIPPVGWIESAHRHGTLVLGTFIFEWEQACRELISAVGDEERRSKVAEQLVCIAKTCGFEGWLFNFEVHLPSRQYVGWIGDLLKQTCDRMKEEIGPHALVLWYDAVTVRGRLRWQNRLNEENYYYFERCDGIFTNYHWHPNDVWSSALSSQGRPWDVFTGIDVFGRGSCVYLNAILLLIILLGLLGTFGGGGFQSYIAAQVAKQMGTSIALFAFGWTLEGCDKDDCFEDNCFRFWEAPTNSIHSVFPPRPLWTQLDEETFWETGCGYHSFVQGQRVVSSKPYIHLRKQQLQPSYTRQHVYWDTKSHRIAPMDATCMVRVSTDMECGYGSGCSLYFQWNKEAVMERGWIAHILAETDIWITKDIFHCRYWLRTRTLEQARLFGIGFVTAGNGTEQQVAIPGNIFSPNVINMFSDTFRWIPCVASQKVCTREQGGVWLETSLELDKEDWEKHVENSSICKVLLWIVLDRGLVNEQDGEHWLTCHLGGIQMQAKAPHKK